MSNLDEIGASIDAKILGLEEEAPSENTPEAQIDESAAGEEEGSPLAGDTGEPEGEKLYAGKYKSLEDFEAGHQALESKIGEMGNELGELRKLLQPETPQQVPVTSDVVEWIQEQAEERPDDAAVWALQNQPALYESVMDVWYTNDPRGAARFERRIEMAQLQQELTSKLEPIVAPVRETAEAQQLQNAWASVSQEIPDMDSLANQMRETLEQQPQLQSLLLLPEPNAREVFLKTLYYTTKGRLGGGTPVGDVVVAASAEEARRQAMLAGSTTSAHPARVQVTPADQAELDLRVGIREAAGLPTDDLFSQ